MKKEEGEGEKGGRRREGGGRRGRGGRMRGRRERRRRKKEEGGGRREECRSQRYNCGCFLVLLCLGSTMQQTLLLLRLLLSPLSSFMLR